MPVSFDPRTQQYRGPDGGMYGGAQYAGMAPPQQDSPAPQPQQSGGAAQTGAQNPVASQPQQPMSHQRMMYGQGMPGRGMGGYGYGRGMQGGYGGGGGYGGNGWGSQPQSMPWYMNRGMNPRMQGGAGGYTGVNTDFTGQQQSSGPQYTGPQHQMPTGQLNFNPGYFRGGGGGGGMGGGIGQQQPFTGQNTVFTGDQQASGGTPYTGPQRQIADTQQLNPGYGGSGQWWQQGPPQQQSGMARRGGPRRF